MFRLLRYFSISSLVVLIIVTGMLSFFYRRIAVEQLIKLEEDKNVALTKTFANSIWPDYATFLLSVSELEADEIRSRPETAMLHEEILTKMSGLSVIKVKVYNLDGKTVFSTEAKQIGEDKSDNAGFRSARAEVPASELSYRDTFSAFEGIISDRDVVASYVPIQPAESGSSVEGVFELYSDVTQLMQRIEDTQRNIAFGVISISALLYTVLFIIVRRADTIIKDQYQELQINEAALQNAKEELENRVENRTAALRQISEQRERLLVSEREQRLLAETLSRLGLALNATLDLPTLLDLISEESSALFKVESALVWLVDGNQLIGFAGHGHKREDFIGMHFSLSDPIALAPRVIREKQPFFVNNARHSEFADQEFVEKFGSESMLGMPLVKGDRAHGALILIDTQNPQRFNQQDVEIAQLLGNQAALAIDNARLLEETQERLQRLTALRTIDLTISGSLDLRVTLNVLLDQMVNTLGIDAANVLLLDPTSRTLNRTAGLGFKTGALRHTHLRLGEGYAGQAALERRIISITNLADNPGGLQRSFEFAREGFSVYIAVPLIAKGQVKGVLEVFQHKPMDPDPEWIEYLETLAGQAAIAIDNVVLFDDLQRSNTKLKLAYDTTLEGWARALELRDRETEGHTQRVTEMTIRLTRKLGVEDHELIHIQRGAILHDIGKMGIPDGILLKPGPLDDDEWVIMRKHPEYAYQMLSQIDFLRPALDIPYCHHEKWDGTGYPRGLKGEQIPKPARIFAVADVWDALRSDRPYRAAWSDEEALNYLREQRGKHFDPQVVDVFLEMLEGRSDLAILDQLQAITQD